MNLQVSISMIMLAISIKSTKPISSSHIIKVLLKIMPIGLDNKVGEQNVAG